MSTIAPAELTSLRRYLTVEAPLQSTYATRSAPLYERVVGQFDVERNPRYLPADGDTYCNVYASDVMAAMHATLPYVVDRRTGKPSRLGMLEAQEQSANRMAAWLREHGAAYMWVEVSNRTAQESASLGLPVVAVWENPAGVHGHIAVVVPGEWCDGGPWMSQAGATNHARALRNLCFSPRKTVTYYRHP